MTFAWDVNLLQMLVLDDKKFEMFYILLSSGQHEEWQNAVDGQ